MIKIITKRDTLIGCPCINVTYEDGTYEDLNLMEYDKMLESGEYQIVDKFED